MRRNVPKVLVTITDGRSQDEVKTKAAKLQHAGNGPKRTHNASPQRTAGEKRRSSWFHVTPPPSLPGSVPSPGYSVFAIGVADVDFVELQEIGSKPSERHVFVVDDFDAFDTIKENLITFICETASSCKSAARPPRPPRRDPQGSASMERK